MLVDSLQMTDADRAGDRRALPRLRRDRASSSRTAPTRWSRPRRVLARHVPGKTIVLTGAMVPYAFGSSDGLFNLGSALSFVAGAARRRLDRDERDALRVGQGQEEPDVRESFEAVVSR